jgi:hypothetical protein
MVLVRRKPKKKEKATKFLPKFTRLINMFQNFSIQFINKGKGKSTVGIVKRILIVAHKDGYTRLIF